MRIGLYLSFIPFFYSEKNRHGKGNSAQKQKGSHHRKVGPLEPCAIMWWLTPHGPHTPLLQPPKNPWFLSFLCLSLSPFPMPSLSWNSPFLSPPLTFLPSSLSSPFPSSSSSSYLFSLVCSRYLCPHQEKPKKKNKRTTGLLLSLLLFSLSLLSLAFYWLSWSMCQRGFFCLLSLWVGPSCVRRKSQKSIVPQRFSYHFIPTHLKCQTSVPSQQLKSRKLLRSLLIPPHFPCSPCISLLKTLLLSRPCLPFAF